MNKYYIYNNELRGLSCFAGLQIVRGLSYYVPVFCSKTALDNYLKFLNDIGVAQRFIIDKVEEAVRFTCNYDPIGRKQGLLFCVFTRYIGEFSDIIDKVFASYENGVKVEEKFNEFLAAHLNITFNSGYNLNHSLTGIATAYYVTGIEKAEDFVTLDEFKANSEKLFDSVFLYFSKKRN